jgi:hypothetical protein
MILIEPSLKAHHSCALCREFRGLTIPQLILARVDEVME